MLGRPSRIDVEAADRVQSVWVNSPKLRPVRSSGPAACPLHQLDPHHPRRLCAGSEATTHARRRGGVTQMPFFAFLLVLAAVLAGTFVALIRILPQGPRAVLALAAVLTATAGLIGALAGGFGFFVA